MLRKKNEMSVFYDGYIERNPLKWLKRFGRQWKWAYQRATKGYADCDTWSISSWFLSVIPDMLDQMSDHLHSYPTFINDGTQPRSQAIVIDDEDNDAVKKWQEILREIAKKLRDADESQSSIKNKHEEEWSKAYREFHKEYGLFGEKLEQEAINSKKPGIQMHFPDEFPQWKEIMDRYREEEKQVLKKRAQSLEDGLNLFKKWFWDLWD